MTSEQCLVLLSSLENSLTLQEDHRIVPTQMQIQHFHKGHKSRVLHCPEPCKFKHTERQMGSCRIPYPVLTILGIVSVPVARIHCVAAREKKLLFQTWRGKSMVPRGGADGFSALKRSIVFIAARWVYGSVI